jgi:hypothetical protein
MYPGAVTTDPYNSPITTLAIEEEPTENTSIKACGVPTIDGKVEILGAPGTPLHPRGPLSPVMSRKLILSNICYVTTGKELQTHVEDRFGRMEYVQIFTELSNGRSRSTGKGEVVFGSTQEMQAARHRLHKSWLDGRQLLAYCAPHRPPPPRPAVAEPRWREAASTYPAAMEGMLPFRPPSPHISPSQTLFHRAMCKGRPGQTTVGPLHPDCPPPTVETPAQYFQLSLALGRLLRGREKFWLSPQPLDTYGYYDAGEVFEALQGMAHAPEQSLGPAEVSYMQLASVVAMSYSKANRTHRFELTNQAYPGKWVIRAVHGHSRPTKACITDAHLPVLGQRRSVPHNQRQRSRSPWRGSY